MVGNPETSDINPDTPENPYIPDIKSGYFGICIIVDVMLSRVVVCVYGLGLFQSYKSYCMHSHVICIRVDTAAEAVVYEVIAKPQEHPEQAQQEVHEHPARGPVDSSSEQRPEGKPRCMSYYFNL